MSPPSKKKDDTIEDNGNLHEADTDMSAYDVGSCKSSDAIASCQTPMDHYGIGEDMEYTSKSPLNIVNVRLD